MTLEDLEFQSARIAEAGYPLHDQETVNIARAHLAILPVCRAAEEWEHSLAEPNGGRRRIKEHETLWSLKCTLDTARKAMEGME